MVFLLTQLAFKYKQEVINATILKYYLFFESCIVKLLLTVGIICSLVLLIVYMHKKCSIYVVYIGFLSLYLLFYGIFCCKSYLIFKGFNGAAIDKRVDIASIFFVLLSVIEVSLGIIYYCYYRIYFIEPNHTCYYLQEVPQKIIYFCSSIAIDHVELFSFIVAAAALSHCLPGLYIMLITIPLSTIFFYLKERSYIHILFHDLLNN